MNKIPAWLETLVLRINKNLSNKDKAHSIVLDNKAISKLTDKDYDYIWHQISILRLERLLKLKQQQLGKCITKRVPQHLIETINALELCIDYHKYPTDSKQQIAREAANTAVDSAYLAYSAAYSAASSTDLAVDSTNSAYSAARAASSAANSASSATWAAYSAARAAPWKQEAIDLSKVLSEVCHGL